MSIFYCINDEIVPAKEAKIGINDLGLLRGYGIFDYCRASNGVPIFIEDHLERFARSARHMALDSPYTANEIHRKVLELMRLNQLEESGIRLMMTGGHSPDGYEPAERPNFFIMEYPFRGYDESLFTDGIKLILHEYIRETPRVKTTNYLTSIKLRASIKAAEAMDVLYHYEGWISESSRSNFFLITKDGHLATPEDFILYGITRKKTLDIAKQLLPVEVRKVHINEIKDAQEVFITSTTKGIMPVRQIDDQIIRKGKIGPITKKLKEMLEVCKLDYIAAHSQTQVR